MYAGAIGIAPQTVEALSASLDVVTIDADDYDESYATNTDPCLYITLDDAKAAALAHIGATDAVFDDDGKLEKDDGLVVYELELTVDMIEYDITVNAVTGEIVDCDSETEDD